MTALHVTSVLSPSASKRFVADLLAGHAPSGGEIADVVASGMDVTALDPILAVGLTLSESSRLLDVNERTIRRRIAAGGSLGVGETDRLVRIASVLGEAERSIGDRTRAMAWLRGSNWGLGDRVPMDLLVSETGAAMVRRALAAIAYGGVA